MANGRWKQCQRAACWRLGARVCGMHGSTWPIRVLGGERQNPVMSSLQFGRRSSDRTLDVAVDDPSLRQFVLGEWTERAIRRITRGMSARLAAMKAEEDALFGPRKRGRLSKAEKAAQRAALDASIIERLRAGSSSR
jgi:hypothetical protein